jgi:hypothetical protein
MQLTVGSGIEDPVGLLAVTLEVDQPHMPKHPFAKERDALIAMMPHHKNIIRIWNAFTEDGIVPKIAKALPEFILTKFEDKISIDPEWEPTVRQLQWLQCVRVATRGNIIRGIISKFVVMLWVHCCSCS